MGAVGLVALKMELGVAVGTAAGPIKADNGDAAAGAAVGVAGATAGAAAAISPDRFKEELAETSNIAHVSNKLHLITGIIQL